MKVRKQPETPEGYVARARAVFKLGQRPPHIATGRRYSLAEFLHAADIEGA